MISLFLLLLPMISNTAASSASFCFSKGITWSSPVTSGLQSVDSPEECQLICADSSECDAVTWYDGNASPHSDYCELFLSPDTNKQVICSNCTSGPQSCTCSGKFTCALDSQLLQLTSEVTNEIGCAELCFQNLECKYYSWYSAEHPILQEKCALLRGCSKRTGSNSCVSGPSDCTDADIVESDYPLCYSTDLTWSGNMSQGLPNVTSPYACQEMCLLDGQCSSFTWYNSLSINHNNFCEFYPYEVSAPTSTCNDCVSGLSSCTCSVFNYDTCDTSDNSVMDIVLNVESELNCQDLCRREEDCSWYTWYSEEGDRLRLACILLESCNIKMDCQGCFSGPDNCENVDLISLPMLPAQCVNYKHLNSYTRNVKNPSGSDCNGGRCYDNLGHPNAPLDWAGSAWYRFSGAAGSAIAESTPVYNLCGTAYGGYMVGGHPTLKGEVVTRTVYFDKNGSPSYPENIQVVKCGSYYVYYLPNDEIGSYSSYCGV